jgi:hypothetical protein
MGATLSDIGVIRGRARMHILKFLDDCEFL